MQTARSSDVDSQQTSTALAPGLFFPVHSFEIASSEARSFVDDSYQRIASAAKALHCCQSQAAALIA